MSRKWCVVSLLSLVMCACETSGRGNPSGAVAVNADIEQRIEARVLEGRSTGAPDLRDVPDSPPPLPSQRTMASERADLADAARALGADISAQKQTPVVDAAVLDRAEQLRRRVAADRAAAAAEGSLADRDLQAESPPSR